MKIRTRMAGAIAGTAFAGLAALAVGTAAPADAQQAQPTKPAVSTAAPQLTMHDGCGWWNDYCGWDDDGWDSWGGGYHHWGDGWGW